MRCLLCKSPRILKFIDGFGERRVFCRGCGRSFIEEIFVKLNGQKKLHDFRTDSYYKNLPVQSVR